MNGTKLYSRIVGVILDSKTKKSDIEENIEGNRKRNQKSILESSTKDQFKLEIHKESRELEIQMESWKSLKQQVLGRIELQWSYTI
jgi:hypothetical protein